MLIVEGESGCIGRLSDDTLEALLVPLDSLGLVDTVRGTDSALGSSSSRDTLTRSGPNKFLSANLLPSHLNP